MVAFLSLFIILLLLGLASMAISGSSGDFGNMTVFGPSTTLTCEWTQGNQALLVTDSGHRRLVDLGKEKVIAGKKYKIVQGPAMRWIPGAKHLLAV